MSKDKNEVKDIVFDITYGAMAVGVIIWGVSQLIEACRSRPKVQVLAFGLGKPKGSNNGEKVKVESSMSQE